MFEKLCNFRVGVVLSCLAVIVVNAMAVRTPTIVTVIAASLRDRGMVIIGVFDGRKFNVMISPAIMLPHARRLMGLITAGLFSLIGVRVVKRGVPIVTK